MAEKVILSKRYKVSLIEWLKSAGYAVGTAVLFELQNYLDKGDLAINWQQVGKIALGAFILFVSGKALGKPSVKTIYNTNEKATEIANDLK